MGCAAHWGRALKWSDRRMVRAIGVFKLAKAALLLGVGLAALRLVHTDIAAILEAWVPHVGLEPGGQGEMIYGRGNPGAL